MRNVEVLGNTLNVVSHIFVILTVVVQLYLDEFLLDGFCSL